MRRAGPASGRSTPRGLGVRARQDALGQEQGRRNALLPWPVRLGVGLSFDENDKPHLIFEREEFSMSEAASYFEYTLDVAIRAQLLVKHTTVAVDLEMISGGVFSQRKGVSPDLSRTATMARQARQIVS